MSTVTPGTTNSTPTPTPDPQLDPVLSKAKQEAEARKAIAEAEKATADAQKAALEAKYPKSSVTALEGTTTAGDGTGLIADLLAHAQLNEGAKAIVADVGGRLTKDARVMVVEDRDLLPLEWPRQLLAVELDNYTNALNQMKTLLEGAIPSESPSGGDGDSTIVIEGLEAAFAALDRHQVLATASTLTAASAAVPAAAAVASAASPLTAALIGIPAVVGAAAEVAGLFRSNYGITKRDVTVGTTPLVAAVASELISKNHSPEIEDFRLLGETTVVTEFKNALQTSIEVAGLKARLSGEVVEPAKKRVERLKESLKEASKAVTDATKEGGAGLTRLETREEELTELLDTAEAAAAKEGIVTSATSLITLFDGFVTKALTPPAPDKPGYAPLLAAALAERLHDGTDRLTHVLYVGVESAAGESITKQSRWWSSGHVRYVGGLQVAWLLLDLATNRVTAAGAKPLAAQMKFDLGDGYTEQAGPVSLTAVTPPYSPY